MTEDKRYWEQIDDWADSLGADGCTGGTNAFVHCCRRHDAEYRTGTTLEGQSVNKQEADKRFLDCMRNHSKLGYWSPMAYYRYLAVKVFGKPSASSDGVA